MPRLDRLASLDFETTGVNPLECRPVSVALVFLDASGVIDNELSYATMVDAGVEIPEEATKVHGVTRDEVLRYGRPIEEALAVLLARLRHCIEVETPLVICNAPFDWTLLNTECSRLVGCPAPPAIPIIDPMVIDRATDKYRKGKRTLARMAEVYGVELAEAHNAGADAATAGRIAQALVNQTVRLRTTATFRDVHRLQKVWWRTWRDEFVEYRLKRGEDVDELVAGDWPLIRPKGATA